MKGLATEQFVKTYLKSLFQGKNLRPRQGQRDDLLTSLPSTPSTRFSETSLEAELECSGRWCNRSASKRRTQS